MVELKLKNLAVEALRTDAGKHIMNYLESKIVNDSITFEISTLHRNEGVRMLYRDLLNLKKVENGKY